MAVLVFPFQCEAVVEGASPIIGDLVECLERADEVLGMLIADRLDTKIFRLVRRILLVELCGSTCLVCACRGIFV